MSLNMELSVMSPVLAAMNLEDSLAYLKKLGVDSFEIGAGGYPGKAHLDPKEYLGNPEKIEALQALLKKYPAIYIVYKSQDIVNLFFRYAFEMRAVLARLSFIILRCIRRRFQWMSR